MSAKILAQQIRCTDILSGLNNEQLIQIAQNAQLRRFQAEDLIAEKGTNSTHAIIILNGTFACTEGVGEGKKFGEDHIGTIIGEMAMFIDDFEHPSTFIATSEVNAIQLERSIMLKLMENDQDLAARFVSKVAGRLGEIISAVSEIEKSMSDYGKQCVKEAA